MENLSDTYERLLNSNCDIVVAFSGGKDSVAMVLHLFDLGIDKSRIILHHHDVDGGSKLFDWPCTPSYCKAFAKHFGLQIIFSWRSGGIKREMLRENEGLQDVYYEDKHGIHRLVSRPGNNTRQKFPAVSANLQTRWCSWVAKIGVMSRVLRDIYKLPTQVVVMTGERREESTNRSKYSQFEWHRTNSKIRKVLHARPVIDWTEEQIWAIMEKYNVCPHPAYWLGFGRCSCMCCIFNNKNAWATIKVLDPDRVNEFAGLEKQFQFTLYKGVTIHEKASSGKSWMDPMIKMVWELQAMNEFTMPIQVNDWKLPPGAYKNESCGSI